MRSGLRNNMNGQEINKEWLNVVNILVLLLALAAVCRIVMLCRAGGMLYSFGIFYLAILCGVYCVLKKALFLREAFFAVWVRVLLALFFTGMQVLGMYYSVPGMEERVHPLELLLWILCLSPLTYGAQNMLFAWVAGCSCSHSAELGDGLTAYGNCDAERMGKSVKDKGASEESTFPALKHFFAAYAVILLGFLIPFATYYPAIMAYDVIPQLDQIRISGYTTHHPLIHTLMLSMSLKIGELLPMVHNADRAGLAVYTILQMLIVAGCFAYVYVFLRQKGVHKYVCYFFVLCVAFYPTHGMLAVSITKDTIYAVLVMVFTAFVCELITRKDGEQLSRGWMGAYFVLTVFLLLFRNNSVYAWVFFVIVTTVVLSRELKADRDFFKKICLIHGAAFLCYLLLNMGMAAASHASSTTYAREMLSVPAQQIARVIAYHEEELTNEDRERLAVVWGDSLPEYVPAISDRSKRDISNDGAVLSALAREWLSLGARYPGEYVKAFLLKNKGMWYLEDSTYLNDIYSYAKGYLQISYPSNQQEYMQELVPGYERHQKLQILQSIYRYFAAGDEVWRYLPPLALIMQPAFYCWMLFYYCVCCIGLKRGRWLLPALYLLALSGTLLLGPCVLVRYLYPVMLGVTVLVLFAASYRSGYN